MRDGLRSFISELQRRKVTGVAVAYAIVSAGVIGVVADGGPSIGMPPGLIRFVIWCVIGGFPIAILLSWFFRVGPEAPRPRFPQKTLTPQKTPEDIHPPSFTPVIPRKGLYIQTLGGIRIFRDGEEITDLPRKPIRCALLAYVAVEKNPPKEKALALLWPEKDPELARKSLNQTLTELRKDLGDDWVDSKGQFLILREDIGTDLGTYQRAVQNSQWEDALASYNGRFLDGFYLPSAYDFGEWQEQVGRGVDLSQRKANTRLLEEKYKEGDFPTALTLAKSWTDRSPLDDGAQNWFIRLLAETGQRGAAIRHAESFLERLEREDEEPLPETLQLIEEVKRGVRGAKKSTGKEVSAPPPSHPEELRPHPPSPEPLFSWARARFWALAAAVPIVFGLYFIIRLTLFHTFELNPNRVVGFPLFDQRPGSTEGVGIPAILAAAMENAPPLVWIDGWVSLPERQRRDAVSLSSGQARNIAREMGAGSYLLGAIFEVDQNTAVSLRLYDTRKDSLITQATAFGPASENAAGSLALQALNSILLPFLDPGREGDLSYLQGRDPAALAKWIQGEREYRFTRFAEALIFFQDAVALDSLLAPAALKGAQAAEWAHEYEEASSLLDVAIRNDSLLSPRQGYLATGLRFKNRGYPDSALHYLSLAVAEDADWSEAWTALGEVHFHLIPTNSHTPDSAMAAFRMAWERDPGFFPPLIHLTELLLLSGRMEEAEGLIDRIAASRSDPENIARLELMQRCRSSPLSREEWEEEAKRNRGVVLGAGILMASGGRMLECAEGAMRALLSSQDRAFAWDALMGLTGVLVSSGRHQEAREALESAPDMLRQAVPWIVLLAGSAGADLGSWPSELDASIRNRRGPDYGGIDAHTAAALGLWHARVGHVENLLVLHSRIEERLQAFLSDPDRAPDDPFLRRARRMAAALGGHLALAKGDTTRAMESFSTALMDRPQEWLAWQWEEPLAFERIRLAELLLSLGKPAEAYTIAQVFDHPLAIALLYFLPESLSIRQRAALELGWGERAGSCQQRLKQLERPALVGQVPEGP